jgi:phage/plasmid-like protein (TIGR03299 family)
MVVCWNTLTQALHESVDARFKVKHTSNSNLRLGEARAALNIMHQSTDEFEKELTRLTSEVVTDRRWEAFLDAHIPVNPESARSVSMADRKRRELRLLWETSEMVTPWKGSAYGVLAAVNTHRHHMATVRGTDRATRNMERTVLGGNANLDSKVLATLARV